MYICLQTLYQLQFRGLSLCHTLEKAYGETAKECADAYFCYGQALLDLARMENELQGLTLFKELLIFDPRILLHMKYFNHCFKGSMPF
jgi:hypothetical protein